MTNRSSDARIRVATAQNDLRYDCFATAHSSRGYFDAKKTFDLGLPITVSAGVKSRLTAYDLWKTGALTWTYIGAARDWQSKHCFFRVKP